MVGLLRRVFGFGLSAEFKDTIKLNKQLQRYDLTKENDFSRAIDLVGRSTLLRHALIKNIITTVDKERIKEFVAERTPDGILLALLRYVAVIRKADVNLPAFKDPGALSHILELRDLFPNARVINMIRRGEDVASSTLKFNWGATNHIAGVLDWRNTLSKAMNDLTLFPDDQVLHLRIEDSHENLENFTSQLVQFIEKNFGLFQKDVLKQDLEQSLGSVKTYQVPGFQGFLVKKLAQNLNYRLGYPVLPLPLWQEYVYLTMSLPFILLDRAIRGLRVFRRKLKFNEFYF